MRKNSIVFILSLLYINNSIAQSKTQKDDEMKIKSMVVKFSNWHKDGMPDSTFVKYSITKGGYPDSTTKTAIGF